MLFGPPSREDSDGGGTGRYRAAFVAATSYRYELRRERGIVATGQLTVEAPRGRGVSCLAVLDGRTLEWRWRAALPTRVSA